MTTRPCVRLAAWAGVHFGAALLLALAMPLRAGATTAQQVSTGQNHSCALTDTGAVLCWGSNFEGRLGDGSGMDSAVPTPVSALGSGVLTLGAGVAHSCAVDAGGGAWCWGRGGGGQLGDGSTSDSDVPVAVSGLPGGLTAVSAGYAHSCGLTALGGVLCWGLNDDGELGDGTNSDSSTPVAVTGLASGVAEISVGDQHSCALTDTGAMLCWGSDLSGQLGNGAGGDSNVPVAVSGLGSGVEAIAAGGTFSCAVLSGGEVRCWGSNAYGQLGDGVIASSDVPVTVSGVSSSATSIATGYGFACAGATSGGVQCWGRGDQGQLGDGNGTDSSSPVAVSGLTAGIRSLSANGFHACAATTAGALRCWGSNDLGQLGDGSTGGTSNVPVAVVGFEVPAVPAVGAPALLVLVAGLAAVARRRLRY